MGLQRYSTPTVQIIVDPTEVADVWLTFADTKRTELFTKTKADMIESSDGFICQLSQSDTALLPEGEMRLVYMQVRVLFKDGSSAATEIEKKTVGQVLKEGIMGD